jgi:para-nitrobenzyl esterase
MTQKGFNSWFQRLRDASVLVVLCAACIGFLACSSSDGPPAAPAAQTGVVFLQGPVSGLNYATQTQSGTTDAQGRFNYLPGETMMLYIGDHPLGDEPFEAGALITMEEEEIEEWGPNNLLVLFELLDQDGDLNNGIQIPQGIGGVLAELDAEIDIDLNVADFPDSAGVVELLGAMNAAGMFTDTHRGPRTPIADAAEKARTNFLRAKSARENGVVAVTTSGNYRGYTHTDANTGAEYLQWLGIRYGENTTGPMRWKAPLAYESAQDYYAFAWGDQAAQNPAYAAYGEGRMSEDCLNLNVTVKKSATGGVPGDLPVMVWFHGGAFGILTSNVNSYNNPASLPSKDVVLVTVNHRLGAFGYLAHPDLSDETDYSGSGNYGQMDLVLALEWVQDNIAAFGGDPGNVTIFGQSGGGAKALSLMASPLAGGLFHKVICQSGMEAGESGTLTGYSLDLAESIGSLLTTEAGKTIAGLRDPGVSWQEIEMAYRVGVIAEFYPGADPVVDGALAGFIPSTNIDHHYMPKSLNAAIQETLPNDVPMLAGATAVDFVAGLDLRPGILEKMPWFPDYNTGPFYVYKWSYVPPGLAQENIGAYHSIDLIYTFAYPISFVTHYFLGLFVDEDTLEPVDLGFDPIGILTATGYFNPFPVPAMESILLTNEVMTIWTNFAKNSNPSVVQIPGVTLGIDWPAYETGEEWYVEIEAREEEPGYALTPKKGLEDAFLPPSVPE